MFILKRKETLTQELFPRPHEILAVALCDLFGSPTTALEKAKEAKQNHVLPEGLEGDVDQLIFAIPLLKSFCSFPDWINTYRS